LAARLKEYAEGLDLHLFSTPFDATAIDFLERMGFPCCKMASFEITDIPLVE
jgi:sialic acid synthase SpsE